MSIINNDLHMKRCKQRHPYLVYLLSGGNMEDEGWSGWMYYAIAHGDTDKEIYNDWIEQVKHIYGVDLFDDLVCIVSKDGSEKWYCYYDLVKTELPVSVYGVSKPLVVEKNYDKYSE